MTAGCGAQIGHRLHVGGNGHGVVPQTMGFKRRLADVRMEGNPLGRQAQLDTIIGDLAEFAGGTQLWLGDDGIAVGHVRVLPHRAGWRRRALTGAANVAQLAAADDH